MLASISLSNILLNKCNIISYWNSRNNGNHNKNRGGDSNSNNDKDNEGNNRAKITRTLINHKTTKYSGYCKNTPQPYVVYILIQDRDLYAETTTGLNFHKQKWQLIH